ncbi:MAG: hypothetical protein LBR19_05460 [Bifidobacteriaceae bacterium]|jgi:hypothetical protein|nr:hypothetical protein [Bifidobacteriaceae bacterium]
MEGPAERSSALDLARAARAQLDGAIFPFPAQTSLAARQDLEDLKATLDTSVIPELERRGVPVLIGLAGSTGVGKSTLTNSLTVAPNQPPPAPVGVLRPTTKTPVLYGRPDSFALLGSHPVRAAAQASLVPHAKHGRLILDCADPFAAGNDPATAQPEGPVSAWLVVTSALRYGDAVVWDLLQTFSPRRPASPPPPDSDDVAADVDQPANQANQAASAAFPAADVDQPANLAASAAAPAAPAAAPAVAVAPPGTDDPTPRTDELPIVGEWAASGTDEAAGAVAEPAGEAAQAASAADAATPGADEPATPIALVIDRTLPAAHAAVEQDARTRLDALGFTDVPLFVLPAEAGKPDRLPNKATKPLRRWLDQVAPRPPKPGRKAPPVRPALLDVVDRLRNLGEAQAVHIAAVDMLKHATDQAVGDLADEAADITHAKEADKRIVDAWLEHIGHGGALTGVGGQEGQLPEDPEAREGWVAALADVDRAVAQVDSEVVTREVIAAREHLVAVWRGPEVPQGTRELLAERQLAGLELPEQLRGVAAHRLWGDALTAVIEAMEAPGVVQAVGAVGAEGLATLVKASVLGAAGPKSLLVSLAPDDAEGLINTAYGARARARAKAVRQVCEPFTRAVAQVTVRRSKELTTLAGQLARVAEEGADDDH